METSPRAKTEEPLETVFSARSVQSCYNRKGWGQPVSCEIVCEEETRRLVRDGSWPDSSVVVVKENT